MRVSALLFRSRELIQRDPSEVARIAVSGGATVERGELVGEWKPVEPANASMVDSAMVSSVARALTQLTAAEFVDGRLQERVRVIEVSLDATPLGDPATTRTLRLGKNCRATLDDAPVVFALPRSTCDILLSTWWK